MTEKRFIGSYAGFYDKYKDNRLLWSEWEEITGILNNLNEKSVERSKALSKLQKENEKLKKYNKGQELEIIRLHNLADAMSAVLRELGIYDVYNDEQIENVKRMIVND